MIFLLLKARMLEEAESLLMHIDSHGIPLGDTGGKIYGEFILGHLEISEVIKALSFFDRSRVRGFVPELSCCQALLSALLEVEYGQDFVRVYMDLVHLGFVGFGEKFLESAVRHLCKERRVFEAADLLRRVVGSPAKADPVVFDMIVDGYCRKRDFDDLMGFLRQWNRVPSACICNKIVYSVCRNCGTDEAVQITKNLEDLGCIPEAAMFGILIGWSCKEGKLREALVHLSDLLSRELKPDVHCYNAIICGLFKEGMWGQVKDVLIDMAEFGVEPDASTFSIVLAGYCNERQFDEVRLIIEDMERRGMVTLGPSDDPLSKVFTMLGLGHLGVKVKRCKDIGIQKVEFLDSLGNGLYLDTDIDDYNRILAEILDDSMAPCFSVAVLNECRNGNVDAALKLKEEGSCYGQDLSLNAYSMLAKCLVTSLSSPSNVSKVIGLVDEMPELLDQLDQQTLNKLIRIFCKEGFSIKARSILDRTVRRGLPVRMETHSTLLSCLYRKKNKYRFKECWEFARESGLLLEVKEFHCYARFLCKLGMVKEALQLFECMLERFSSSSSILYDSMLKRLCSIGSTRIAYNLWKDATQMNLELEERTYEHLVNALYHANMLKEVREVLDFLISRNVIHTLSLCQLTVPLFVRFNEIEKAMDLKMVILNNSRNASHAVYKVLISALCNAGYMKEATVQLLEMNREGLRLNTYILNTMLVGYVQEGEVTYSNEVLCFMLKRNIAFCLRSYRWLVRLTCCRGRLFSGLNLKNLLMLRNEPQPIALYNIVMFSLFQSKHGSFIEFVLKEIREKKLMLDQVSYDFLVYGYMKCGDISKSLDALYAMIEKNLKPSRRSFRIGMHYLCKNLEINKALELTKVMELWGIKHGPVIHCELVGCLLSHGMLDDTEELLAQFEQKGLVPENMCYDGIIRMLCTYGRVCKATELLNMMLERGNLPSRVSYNSIIKGLIHLNDYDQALDFLVEMHHKNLDPDKDVCIMLVENLCECQRTDDARSVLELALKSGQILPDHVIYSIINNYVAEHKPREASDFMSKMKRNGHLPDFKTHWSLISSLGCANEKSDAHDKTFLSHLLSQSGFASLVQRTKL